MDELTRPRQDEQAEVRRLQWLYAELVRIESHWTEQIQSQHRTSSTQMTMTSGFLLGAAFLAQKMKGPPLSEWWAYAYMGSLLCLCGAFIIGMWSMVQKRIPIAGEQREPPSRRCAALVHDIAARVAGKKVHPSLPEAEPDLWLNAKTLWDRCDAHDESVAVLRDLCNSVVENQRTAHHNEKLVIRRRWAAGQIRLLFLSVLLMIVALCGFVTTGKGPQGEQDERVLHVKGAFEGG